MNQNEQQNGLHAQIMNLQPRWSNVNYLAGHCDARHAAADLVSAALSSSASEPVVKRLHRDEVIDLISPLSNNSADHDIEFANRVMDAMLSASPRPQEPTDAAMLWLGQVRDDFRRMAEDANRLLAQRCAELAALPQEPREAALTDELALHLWDIHVAYETGASAKQPPLTDKDKLAFARAIESEIRGAQEVKAGEWLPIESAPKDGSHVQLFRPEIQFVGYYAVNAGCWCINAPRLPVMEPAPTHWKPLDAPPSPTLNEPADSRGEKQ